MHGEITARETTGVAPELFLCWREHTVTKGDCDENVTKVRGGYVLLWGRRQYVFQASTRITLGTRDWSGWVLWYVMEDNGYFKKMCADINLVWRWGSFRRPMMYRISPLYIALRAIVEVLGTVVTNGKLGSHKHTLRGA